MRSLLLVLIGVFVVYGTVLETCEPYKACDLCLAVPGCNYCVKSMGTSFCTNLTTAIEANCTMSECSNDVWSDTPAKCYGGCSSRDSCEQCSKLSGCQWCQQTMNGGGKCFDPKTETESVMCNVLANEDCSLPCSARSGCNQCTKRDQCVWCEKEGVCSKEDEAVCSEPFTSATCSAVDTKTPSKSPAPSKMNHQAITTTSTPSSSKRAFSIFVVLCAILGFAYLGYKNSS